MEFYRNVLQFAAIRSWPLRCQPPPRMCDLINVNCLADRVLSDASRIFHKVIKSSLSSLLGLQAGYPPRQSLNYIS